MTDSASVPASGLLREQTQAVLDMAESATPNEDWPPPPDKETDADSYLIGCCRDAVPMLARALLRHLDENERLRGALGAAPTPDEMYSLSPFNDTLYRSWYRDVRSNALEGGDKK
jgi:hypothetical protein